MPAMAESGLTLAQFKKTDEPSQMVRAWEDITIGQPHKQFGLKEKLALLSSLFFGPMFSWLS